MGIKPVLNLLQQAGKIAGRYMDDAARITASKGEDAFGALVRKADDVNLEGLRLAPQLIGDTVSIQPQNKIVPLWRQSPQADFFGVTDVASINKKMANHAILALEKENKGEFVNLTNIYLDDSYEIFSACQRLFSGANAQIQNLKQIGAGRLTFNSKMFGQNGNIGSHTIGLVFDKELNTLYVLDSVNESLQSIEMYKKIIKEKLFSRPEFKREFSQIIYSTKSQQKPNEYTCNNWAVANIEALKKNLSEGNLIRTSDELNEILPDDINKILDEQQYFVMENRYKYPYLY